MHPDNIASDKYFVLCRRFKVCMGARYLGVFVGGDESKLNWLKYRTMKKDKDIRRITKTAVKYPQDSYATVVLAIQSEWIFCNA